MNKQRVKNNGKRPITCFGTVFAVGQVSQPVNVDRINKRLFDDGVLEIVKDGKEVEMMTEPEKQEKKKGGRPKKETGERK